MFVFDVKEGPKNPKTKARVDMMMKKLDEATNKTNWPATLSNVCVLLEQNNLLLVSIYRELTDIREVLEQ
jgi:hypothetical protein